MLMNYFLFFFTIVFHQQRKNYETSHKSSRRLRQKRKLKTWADEMGNSHQEDKYSRNTQLLLTKAFMMRVELSIVLGGRCDVTLLN